MEQRSCLAPWITRRVGHLTRDVTSSSTPGPAGGLPHWRSWSSRSGIRSTRQQHVIVDRLEQIFVRYLPVIRLTNGVNYSEYNVLHYTGFPSAGDNDAMQGACYDTAAG
jgi:hypothetical protein